MPRTNNVHIVSRLRSSWNTAVYQSIARRILGLDYDLSIVLVGDGTMRRLNRETRNKTGTSNVLSFPLSENSGELFLNVAKIRREAHRFGLTAEGHAAFLLIHGCLHLKGHDHGSTMEQAEDKLLKHFNIR